MNNSSDLDDLPLTSFLREYRSTAPPGSLELEDNLITEIDDRSEVRERRVFRLWLKYLSKLFGAIGTGFLGAGIHYMMNPPEPNVAQTDRLDRYITAHWQGIIVKPNLIDRYENLDTYLLQEDDEGS